jgi:hypothetical protein
MVSVQYRCSTGAESSYTQSSTLGRALTLLGVGCVVSTPKIIVCEFSCPLSDAAQAGTPCSTTHPTHPTPDTAVRASRAGLVLHPLLHRALHSTSRPATELVTTELDGGEMSLSSALLLGLVLGFLLPVPSQAGGRRAPNPRRAPKARDEGRDEETPAARTAWRAVAK